MRPCLGGKECHNGACKANPCKAADPNPCTDAAKPYCTLAADFTAACAAQCDSTTPCGDGSICHAGACKPDPCAAGRSPCGAPTPLCSVADDGVNALCTPECDAENSCVAGMICHAGACTADPCSAAPFPCAAPTPLCSVAEDGVTPLCSAAPNGRRVLAGGRRALPAR